MFLEEFHIIMLKLVLFRFHMPTLYKENTHNTQRCAFTGNLKKHILKTKEIRDYFNMVFVFLVLFAYLNPETL